MNDFDYYGLFVNENDRADLIKGMENLIDINNLKDASIYCDHVTLLHISQMRMEGASELKKYLDNNLNKSFKVNVTSIGISTKCIACGIEFIDNIKSMNVQPHITMVTYNGGKPFMSNQITKWESIPKVTYTLMLKKIVH